MEEKQQNNITIAIEALILQVQATTANLDRFIAKGEKERAERKELEAKREAEHEKERLERKELEAKRDAEQAKRDAKRDAERAKWEAEMKSMNKRFG